MGFSSFQSALQLQVGSEAGTMEGLGVLGSPGGNRVVPAVPKQHLGPQHQVCTSPKEQLEGSSSLLAAVE